MYKVLLEFIESNKIPETYKELEYALQDLFDYIVENTTNETFRAFNCEYESYNARELFLTSKMTKKEAVAHQYLDVILIFYSNYAESYERLKKRLIDIINPFMRKNLFTNLEITVERLRGIDDIAIGNILSVAVGFYCKQSLESARFRLYFRGE